MRLVKDIKNRFNMYIIAIMLIAVSLTWMHINQFMYLSLESIKYYNYQIDIANGLIGNSSPDMQQRLLYPKMLQFIGKLMPKELLPHVYHPSLSLAAAEWITVFFCLLGLFLLSNEILKSRLRSFLVIIAYSIYLPYVFTVSPNRFGDSLIVGFFCFLAYAVLTKRHRLFILLLLLCSFQRFDIAFTSVFLKVVYEYFRFGKRFTVVLANSLLFIIPIGIILWIVNYYGLTHASFYSDMILSLVYAKGNIIVLPIVFLCYLPLIIFTIIRFRKFDKDVYYLMIGLLPHSIMAFFIGGFSETRHLHPLFVTFMIGIFSTIKDIDIQNFVDSELSLKNNV